MSKYYLRGFELFDQIPNEPLGKLFFERIKSKASTEVLVSI